MFSEIETEVGNIQTKKYSSEKLLNYKTEGTIWRMFYKNELSPLSFFRKETNVNLNFSTSENVA